MTNGEMTAGASPSRTSVSAKLAASLATAMSQQATRPTPPPRAAPWMRPTIGLGHASMASKKPAIFMASAALSTLPKWAIDFIHWMSAPAQKLLPAPPMTTTCTLGSLPSPENSSCSAMTRSPLKALPVSGRFSVTWRTLSCRSRSRVSFMVILA